MALANSIKMYLTIFVATTCIYMVLYQYHVTRQPQEMSSLEIVKLEEQKLIPMMSSSPQQASGTEPAKSVAPSEAPQMLRAGLDAAAAVPAVSLASPSSSASLAAGDPGGMAAPHDGAIVAHDAAAAHVVATDAYSLPAPARRVQRTQGELPPLYIITPTYRRVEQLADLTRLGYTLKHVMNLLWLVIEDANKTSPQVVATLNRIGVPYEYLLAPMPEEYKVGKKAKPRGVSNRNRGLQWLRANASEGVFYFADDDNTYDISIFEQMRYTKKVSMWPVGLVTKYGVSTPIVRNHTVIGFYDGWIGGRKFPVDMAGFAVSVAFLHERPAALMPYRAGYEEDGFLKSLAPLEVKEIEVLANDCTEILTWHTQTKKNSPASPVNVTQHHHTNLIEIEKQLVRP